MNDLLKLLSNSLKPFGYHVRPRKGLDFLHISNLQGSEHKENTGNLLKAGSRLPQPDRPKGLNELLVIYRTCVRRDRNIDTRPRVTGVTLEENMKRCFRSLLTSIKFASDRMASTRIRLLVLDDRSDPGIRDDIAQMIKKSGLADAKIQTTAQTGQGASLYEQFETARETAPCMVYFIEDDYLHEPDALYRLCQFYRDMNGKIGSHMVLYPQEHPVMYDQHYPSYIVMGQDRHWRTIRHATHSFFTHTDVVRRYWKYFKNTKFVGNRKKRRKGSEDKTTNLIFKHIPAFAPLAPLAVHLQFQDTLPPLFDWRPLWKENAPGNQEESVPKGVPEEVA